MQKPCPSDPDETAEAFMRGGLLTAQAALFVGHLEQCAPCRQVLDFNRRFASAMRRAATEYVTRSRKARAASAGEG